jgi:hypothetical protein
MSVLAKPAGDADTVGCNGTGGNWAAQQYIYNSCMLQNSCSFIAETSVLGDACPGKVSLQSGLK